jgi:acetyl esterase/lipase
VIRSGAAVLSADYALLPESTGWDILEDVKDLFAFIDADKRFDGSRIAVLGSSAGNYPLLLAAIEAHPRPKVLGWSWGMGMFLADDFWFRTRSELPPSLAHLGADSDFARFFLEGTLLDDLTGQAGLGAAARSATDPVSVISANLRPLFPELSLNSSFPPIALIHGTADTVVPASETVALADQLRALGVEVQLELAEGGVHGLHNATAGDEATQALRERQIDFVLERL